MGKHITKTAELKNYIFDQLRQRGCRITKQREILIDVILRERCNNCKEIYYLAIKEDPDIGMATVYRMMNILEEIGVLKWRNEYKLRKQARTMQSTVLVEFEDASYLELKEKGLWDVIEKGLDIRGELKERKIRQVFWSEESSTENV